MERIGVIRSSVSPYTSHLILHKKKDSSYKAVLDLRNMNKVALPMSYRLAYFQDILAFMGDKRYFSYADVCDAYN